MRYAAIIKDSKVSQVVDTALYKVKEPVSMVSIDRYDVMVGDDYTGGKFYRNGVEIPKDPKPQELLTSLSIAEATVAELQAEVLRLRRETDNVADVLVAKEVITEEEKQALSEEEEAEEEVKEPDEPIGKG